MYKLKLNQTLRHDHFINIWIVDNVVPGDSILEEMGVKLRFSGVIIA
jgi:hypothetical protein